MTLRKVVRVNEDLRQVFDILDELHEDGAVSKNVKQKVMDIKKDLSTCSDKEISLRVNKTLSDLEELSSDVNLPMFVRTQIWQLTSLLEKLS